MFGAFADVTISVTDSDGAFLGGVPAGTAGLDSAANIAAMSIVGYRNLVYPSNRALAPLTVSELVLANTNPGGAVYRVAHTRTTGKSAKKGGYAPYFGEPHPVISPRGTRILFASDWYDSGSVDTYVVDLRR
ncbi:MAG: hypothetical protein AB8C46_03405 [Burkholderiaceae bacterium]